MGYSVYGKTLIFNLLLFLSLEQVQKKQTIQRHYLDPERLE